MTAIFPLYRNEVIEEVATYHDLEMVRLYLKIKETDFERKRMGTLDFYCQANETCKEQIVTHQRSAEAIRALQTKDVKP